MSASSNNANAAIFGHASDEAEDFEKAVKQATSGAYRQWPNEACFENLTEQRGPIQLVVHGTIPSWAAGSLFRTGPGSNKIDHVPGQPCGILQLSHWFDGLAHTHHFKIIQDPDHPSQAQVFYSSRRQSDGYVEHVQKHGQRNTVTFAQRSDPCLGIFGKIQSSWRLAKTLPRKTPIENIGVTVQLGVPGFQSESSSMHGGADKQTLWLGTDNNMLRKLDLDTLDPLDVHFQEELHPSLDGPSSCAHAMRCPQTGDYFNVNIKGGPKAKYRVFRVSAESGEIDILAEISRFDVRMAYLHSFFLSEHFVLLRIPSSHMKANGMGILWEKNILDAIVPFSEENKCKWFVVDRVGGRGVVAEFETDAAFFFHTVNCFEEKRPVIAGNFDDGSVQTDIICEVVEYPTMDIIRALSYDALLKRGDAAKDVWGEEKKARNSMPRLVRWKFTLPGVLTSSEAFPSAPSIWNSIWLYLYTLAVNLVHYFSHRKPSTVVKPTRVIHTPHAGELPTINPAYLTHRHRYVYSLTMGGLSTLSDCIIKTDTQTGSVLRWNNLHGHTPGEAIFVARPGAVEEDDGVLLSVVLDGRTEKSYLLCLDASTMTEIGRADVGFAVGHGFHGLHVADGA
ncbi:unnamed protein product [Discula destructiva]